MAAIGGMVLPALLYLAVAGGSATRQGWGVPMATDIAFALGALTVAAAYAPPNLKPLLLTLAIVDDIGAIIIIAVFYAGGLRLVALEEAFVMIVLIVVLRSIHVRWVGAYAVVGVLLWYFTYRSGVHPTIAGVILGLLTPAVPFQRPATVSEQARGTADATTDHPEPPDADAEAWLHLSRLSREAVSPLARLESGLLPWTSFVILPLFALANAGVELSSAALRASATSALALGIVLGLVVGKPLGVLGASWIACRTGVATLPGGVGWGDLAGMGAVAGVGFTMALFIAELAFDPGLALDEAKIAILFASILAAAIGYVILRISPNREPD
jgi:NhaA family Na+:H+ antiporter